MIVAGASSRTRGARIHPRLHEIAELLLGAGRRLSPFAWAPRPPNEIVVRDVVVQQGETAAAVARRILDLSAYLADRFALPRHFNGSQPPPRMAWDAAVEGLSGRQGEVAVGMARGAGEAGDAVVVGPAECRRLMYVVVVTL